MKAYIYWIYFTNKELHHYIRNSSNTDNWSTVKKYGEILTEFKKRIEEQKKQNDTIEKNKTKVQELITNLQITFSKEHSLLGNANIAKLRSYQQQDLEPYLTETKFEKFKQFEERWGSDIEEDWNFYQIIIYLTEWEELNGGKDSLENPYEIYVQERKQGIIKFLWKIPERKFYDLSNYLFYFYGEWMMMADWEQEDYSLVSITAASAIFYNRYWYFLKSNINGVIKYLPNSRAVDEVSSCPNSFGSNPVFYDFVSNYDPKLTLWKAKGGIIEQSSYSYNLNPPYIGTVKLEKFSDNIDISGGVPAVMNEIYKQLWNTGVGTVFFALSERYSSEGFSLDNSRSPNSKIGNIGLCQLNEQGEPKGATIQEVLKSKGLLDKELDFFLRNNITATIYWREKQIWQGNYWLLHNQFSISEAITVAGNTIMIEGSGILLTRVTENITAKVGGNAFVNKFIECAIDTTLNDDKGQNNRQEERRIINSGKDILKHNLFSTNHIKAEYTFEQFISRYFYAKYPIKVRLEFDNVALNYCRNQRELLGRGIAKYYNGPVANLLNVPGYLQMNIISSNYPYGEWFTSKIAKGIYLYEKDPSEFYQKKLSSSISVSSVGAISRGPFDVITITDTVSSGSGWDDISHCGGGLWVRKSSRLWVVDKNGQRTDDLFPWLMQEVNRRQNFINREDSDKWVIKHPTPTFTERIEIPSQYLTNNDRLVDGKPSCQIHYILNFFSGGDSSKEGDEINATHFIITRESQGNKGIITVEIKGSHKITRKVGDPTGIPATTSIPGASDTPEIPEPEPFDPDTPDPNTSEPSPSEPEPRGEPEPGADVPEIDIKDPDSPEDDKKDDEPDKPEGDTRDPDAPNDIPESGDRD